MPMKTERTTKIVKEKTPKKRNRNEHETIALDRTMRHKIVQIRALKHV